MGVYMFLKISFTEEFIFTIFPGNDGGNVEGNG